MLRKQVSIEDHRKPFPILLVEDLRTDAALIQRALGKGGVTNPVYRVKNGEEALNYMYGRGAFTDRNAYPFPGLVILDLKLPRLGGLEVLRRVKAEKVLKRVPILVLTTSNQRKDINSAYDFGANSYLVKPVEHSAFVDIAVKIRSYWLQSNEVPDFVPP